MRSAVIGLAIGVAAVAFASGSQEPAASSTVSRGEYLVHRVAMCVQCHSERDDNGNLLESGLLQGASMPVSSPYRSKPFAFMAPRLAGLPAGYTEESLAHFLQTGETGRDHTPQPPMPPFRMTESDARAVAAYLKSLR